jgi:predicted RNA-binding protein with PUA-like domain
MDYLFEEIKGIAEHSKNAKFDSIVKNPRSSFIDARQKVRNSMIGTSDVRLSQAQCIDMIIPELIEEVSKVNEIARIMLNIKRLGKYL